MASGTVAIRPATAAEAPALSELCRRSKAHWGYDDDFMAACVEELTVRPERYGANEVWVADDGAPVGLYELARISHSLAGRHRGAAAVRGVARLNRRTPLRFSARAWRTSTPHRDDVPQDCEKCGLACEADGVGDVLLFFVSPEAMGRGVGTALWRHMEQRSADRGLTRITVEADPYAAPFYERMGCRLTGSEPSQSIPGRMLPALEKRVQ